MRGFVAAAIIFAALLASAAANVQDANMWRAHKIHADHRSRVSGGESMLLNTNQADAPLVTAETINMAREMAMAEAADDAASAKEDKAKKEAAHAEIRHQVVAELVEPFSHHNPITFLLAGFGAVVVVIVLFWLAERMWLQTSLNLPSFWDAEIDKRMYPLF